jgi:CubicO group peptidase (beta-lactamase class C family)
VMPGTPARTPPAPCRGSRHATAVACGANGCASARRLADRLGRRDVPATSAMDEYLERAAVFGFSGAVVVELRDSVVLMRGVGYANRASLVPATPETPFYLASVSKQFYAVALLALVQDGRARLDDSIAAHLPNVPPDKASITLRQLAAHTSGLSGDDVAATGVGRDAFVARVLARPLVRPPGAGFEYSNDGYGVLAAVIEQVSGAPIARFMEERVFRRAGMTATRLLVDGANAATRPKDATHAYRGMLDQGDVFGSHRIPGWSEVAGTGVISTARDLLRWSHALRGTAVIDSFARATLVTPVAPGYALGLSVRSSPRGAPLVGHGGLWLPEGWGGSQRTFGGEGVFIVLSNAYRTRGLAEVTADALVALSLGGAVQMPPRARACDRTDLAGSVGSYASDGGILFRVHSAPWGATFEPRGQAAVDLVTGASDAAVAAHRDANERARRFVDAVARGDSLSALGAASVDAVEVWRRAREVWAVLASHGALRRVEVTTTEQGPGARALDSYVRLHFERDSASWRVTSANGGITRVSHVDSYVGAQHEVEVLPGPIPLGCLPDGRFVIHELGSGLTRYGRFEPFRGSLTLIGTDRTVTAARVLPE